MSNRYWLLLFCQWQEEIRYADSEIERMRAGLVDGQIPAGIADEIRRLKDRQRAILQQIDGLISSAHNSQN